jgi:hypothetical protein
MLMSEVLIFLGYPVVLTATTDPRICSIVFMISVAGVEQPKAHDAPVISRLLLS